MPTPYRGRVEIKCLKEKCEIDAVRGNVVPACFICELSMPVIIDLDEKPVGDLRKPKTENVKKEVTETKKED